MCLAQGPTHGFASWGLSLLSGVSLPLLSMDPPSRVSSLPSAGHWAEGDGAAGLGRGPGPGQRVLRGARGPG